MALDARSVQWVSLATCLLGLGRISSLLMSGGPSSHPWAQGLVPVPCDLLFRRKPPSALVFEDTEGCQEIQSSPFTSAKPLVCFPLLTENSCVLHLPQGGTQGSTQGSHPPRTAVVCGCTALWKCFWMHAQL